MDPAYQMMAQFKEMGLKLLNQYVNDAVREDLHLDFKRKRNPHTWKMSSDDKRNYSRALSGFANSDSGIIIWGVDAPGSGESIRAKQPISHVKGFAETLDSFISRSVNPSVNGIENLVIFEDEENDIGYVVTYVPKSPNSPHRAESEGLKQYYKRYGESFKVAEHYELEYMFGKRNFPQLGVFWSADTDTPHLTDMPSLVPIKLRIGVKNQGKAIAPYVCLRIRYRPQGPYNLTENLKSDLIHYSEPMKAAKTHFNIITARALMGLVVYPDDYMYFFTFNLTASRSEVVQNGLPQFEVYYDLFGENFAGITNEKLVISGRKIAEKIKKKN